jgi:ketosteroid isomerase-like protein
MSLPAFDSRELERFTRAFEELFYANDPGAMTSYYTEHAQLMAEGMEPIRGHAYALCTVTVDTPGGAGPAGTNGTRIAVWDATIWQRDPGGRWRIAVDISTPLPPR